MRFQVAQTRLSSGYKGCWVLALGTNDTADVYVGSVEDQTARIAKMMNLIGSQPVVWVNVVSQLSDGPYSEKNMQAWNNALVQACTKYPNMRVYDWASAAAKSWFISDGIHYTAAGYAARAHLIASALVHAFPLGSPASSSCMVS